ncbi:MAG TPA: type VI secretion system baseplate subunit TssE [Xanthobacteraceae bacterium]|nr:type VI secretion system baseplate subunit TssE [Xanthobacteraceae bacterium]
MAGSGKKDHLSPPLMHVFRAAFEARDAKKKIDLRDDAGERIIASRRTARRAAITEPVLRREVARDLESLMNTVAMESSQPLDAFEYVRRSVINYGFPDIAHRTIDENAVDDIKDEIKTVLQTFEPRLVHGSVKVARDGTVDRAGLKVRFTVNADLFCDPVNVPVEFVAELEMDSGKIQISRL